MRGKINSLPPRRMKNAPSSLTADLRMWPTIARLEDRPSELMFSRRTKTQPPPSGIECDGSLVSSVISSRGSRSVYPSSRSLSGYNSNLYAGRDDDDDDDDESSCDDTLVSTISSGGLSRSKSQGSHDRILTETSTVSKNSIRSSPNLKRVSNKVECVGYGKNHSTAGVLDMLKDDINSLELLRLQTMECSENERTIDSGSIRLGRDSNIRSKSSMRSPAHRRTRVVDPVFTDADPGSMAFNKLPTSGCENKWQDKKKSKKKAHAHVQNYESLRKFDVLKRENKLLQELVCKVKGDSAKIIDQVKDDSVMIAEHNEKKSTSLKRELSNIKLQLDRSKSKETELERELLEVTNKAESERKMMSETLSTSRAESKVLLKRCEALEQENERMQETACAVKDDSVKKLIEFADVKLQLEKSKSKESKIERILQDVISNVESERKMMSVELSSSRAKNDELLKKLKVLEQENEKLQKVVHTVKDNSVKVAEYNELQMREVVSKIERMSEELSIAYKTHHSEVTLLEERLKGASEDIADKDNLINQLKNNITEIERISHDDTEQTEQKMCRKIERLEMIMKSKESCLLEKIRRRDEELEVSRSAFSELEEKTRLLSDKLSNAESQNQSLIDCFDKAKKEQEVATTAVKTSLQETAEKLGNAIRENHCLNMTLADARVEHREVVNKLSNLTKEKERHIEAVCEVREEKSRLEQLLADTNEDRSKLNEKTSNLETEISSLKNTIAKKDMINSRLELGLAEANASMVDKELEVKNIESKLKRRTQKLESEMDKHVKVLNMKLSTIEEKKNAQAVQIEKLTTSLSESKCKYVETETALKSSVEAAMKINAQIKSSLANAEKKIESLKGKVQVKDRQLMDMDEATELMHDTVYDLKSNIDKSRANSSMMDQEISSLQLELLSANERLQIYKNRNVKLQKELEDMTAGAKASESSLNSTVKALKSELAQAKKKIDKSDPNLSKIEEEHANCNEELKLSTNELMQEENGEVVVSLEGDLERAIKMQQDAEKVPTKRIPEEKSKLLKEPKTC